MLETVRKLWKIEDLRKKIIYTFLMLALFCGVGQIYAPGIDVTKLQTASSFYGWGMLDMMTGGMTSRMTIMAMGISPYINASIIMQLLCIAIPYLERVQEEPDGREKITRWTRYMTIVLAAVQAIGLSTGMGYVYSENRLWNQILVGVSMAGGSALAMWIGERITDKGIGNGISLLIFAGIAGNIFEGLANVIVTLFTAPISSDWWVLLAKLGVFLVAFLVICVAVTFVDLGERRVPLQIAKAVKGRRVYGGQNTHMTLKVVSVGVLPLIFASSFLSFPQIIANFLKDGNGFKTWCNTWLSQSHWFYIIISTLLIVLFTFFYSSISFDAKKQAQQLQEQGATIPGSRSKNIEAYLKRSVNRLNLFAALFLAVLNVVGSMLMSFANIGISFAASSMLIAVSVSLETIRTIKGEMSIRGIDTSKDNGFM